MTLRRSKSNRRKNNFQSETIQFRDMRQAGTDPCLFHHANNIRQLAVCLLFAFVRVQGALLSGYQYHLAGMRTASVLLSACAYHLSGVCADLSVCLAKRLERARLSSDMCAVLSMCAWAHASAPQKPCGSVPVRYLLVTGTEWLENEIRHPSRHARGFTGLGKSSFVLASTSSISLPCSSVWRLPPNGHLSLVGSKQKPPPKKKEEQQVLGCDASLQTLSIKDVANRPASPSPSLTSSEEG